MPATLLMVGLLLSACDTSSSTQDQPSLEMTTQAARSSEVVASGDTVLFEPLQPGEGPCGSPETCDLPPLNVTGAQEQIRITDGYFLASYGIHTLEGEIEKSEQQIEIRIRPADPNGSANRETAPFLYDARVTDLTPGTYQLRIVHENDLLRFIQGDDDSDGRAVVVDQQVIVP